MDFMATGDRDDLNAAVRDGRAEESPALAGLLSQLGHDVPPAWLGTWMGSMNRATDRVLVAEEAGALVGVGVLHATPFIHEAGQRARLTALVVDRGARSRGLGGLLLDACEEVALQMGCSFLEVTTGDWRRDAHRFYERHGYGYVSRRYSKHLRR
jgi:GNAT superfamily N-acetyltransferase